MKWLALSRFATPPARRFVVTKQLINPKAQQCRNVSGKRELCQKPMLFDDRLATVLRSGATGERSRRTMFLQLLDLLGTLPLQSDSPTIDAAFERFEELSKAIPAHERALLVREPGVRLETPRLLSQLAEQEPSVAAAAMNRAQLPADAWLQLIPQLPVRARGFLRNRRDLPGEVSRLLGDLGVRDLVLTPPDAVPLEQVPSAAEEDLILGQAEELQVPTAPQRDDREPIGDIVRRIEEFRKARESAAQSARRAGNTDESPTLPLQGETARDREINAAAFDFMTDPCGRIIWADPAMAPMAVGITLGTFNRDGPVVLDHASCEAIAGRQPVAAGSLSITGAAAVSGHWRIDATPSFRQADGAFEGYSGRLRRRAEALSPEARQSQAADRIRQMLHELRTPVNAIQGFAEVIQQQIFGPAPHEYRALAAGIAGDAARILAGFEELDRLARLESGAADLEQGQCDFAEVLRTTMSRIAPILKNRSSAVTLTHTEDGVVIPMARAEAERLAWRVLASLATAMSAGEELLIDYGCSEGRAVFTFELPAALADSDDLFSASTRASAPQALSAGLFGTGFAFRLARAEARAISGDLTRAQDALLLSLPHLTGEASAHSDASAASTQADPAGIGPEAKGLSKQDNARDNGSAG